jgi:hypothetical protein
MAHSSSSFEKSVYELSMRSELFKITQMYQLLNKNKQLVEIVNQEIVNKESK